MVKERPILFSAAMVRAILEGRKTVTRRVVKPAFPATVRELLPLAGSLDYCMPCHPANPELPWEEEARTCPYGKPGDQLWVQETWGEVNLQDVPGIAYLAGGDVRELRHGRAVFSKRGWRVQSPKSRENRFQAFSGDLRLCAAGRWKPADKMPRWASRIILEVTDVRVERLKDITDEQAKAEGIAPLPCGRYRCGHDEEGVVTSLSPVTAFAWLWESINGAGSWEANPWVWVVAFRRVES